MIYAEKIAIWYGEEGKSIIKVTITLPKISKIQPKIEKSFQRQSTSPRELI